MTGMPPVVAERVFPVPREVRWRAITDPVFTRESCEGGWRCLIQERLAQNLGVRP